MMDCGGGEAWVAASWRVMLRAAAVGIGWNRSGEVELGGTSAVSCEDVEAWAMMLGSVKYAAGGILPRVSMALRAR